MFISDILSQEMRLWQPGSHVLIKAPTGAGKTTFILTCLLNKAISERKEILYLSNRSALHKEIIQMTANHLGLPQECLDFGKPVELPGITVMTYQYLLAKLKKNGSDSIKFYNTIVADEIHYITSDSEFSSCAHQFLRWFKNRSADLKIAISATPEDVEPYLIEYGEWNHMPTKNELQHGLDAYIFEGIISNEHKQVFWRWPKRTWNVVANRFEVLFRYDIEHVGAKYNLIFFDEPNDITKIINNDKSEERWLIFPSNKDKIEKEYAQNLSMSYEFVSADNKDSEVFASIIENKRFKEKVLFATKVIDCGVNIIDETVKNIVIDSANRTDFLQMIGRRRVISTDEVLNLYVQKKTANYFNYVLNSDILPTLSFMKKPQNEILEAIHEDKKSYSLWKRYYEMKNGIHELNYVAKLELEKKKVKFEEFAENLKSNENAFVEAVIEWIGKEKVNDIQFTNDLEKVKAKKDLCNYLESVANTNSKLSKQEQVEFAEIVKEFFLIIKPEEIYHKKNPIGLCKINKLLECIEVNYQIDSMEGKRKGETTTWKVIKI